MRLSTGAVSAQGLDGRSGGWRRPMCLRAPALAAKPRLALAMIVRAIAANAPVRLGCGRYGLRRWRDRKGAAARRQGLCAWRAGQPPVPILAQTTADLPGMASEIAHALDPSLWKRLSAGEGTKGARLHDWAYCELADLDAADNDDQRTGPWTRGLLIRRKHRRRRYGGSSPPGVRPEPASKSWSRSKDIAGRSKIALRRLRTNSGSTTMKRAPGTAGIVTSRSSCSPSP